MQPVTHTVFTAAAWHTPGKARRHTQHQGDGEVQRAARRSTLAEGSRCLLATDDVCCQITAARRERLQINWSPCAPKRCSERQREESSRRVSIENGWESYEEPGAHGNTPCTATSVTMCSAPRSSQAFSIETRRTQCAHENLRSEPFSEMVVSIVFL